MVQNSLNMGRQISHYPMSTRAKRAVRSERMSERCERTSERTSEWPSTNVPISRDSESLRADEAKEVKRQDSNGGKEKTNKANRPTMRP